MGTITDDYRHAMDMVREVERGPVSKFSAETRCFAELIRSVENYHRETQKRADWAQAELTEARGKLAGMRTLRRDRGDGRWCVDHKTLEKITAKADQIEYVSVGAVEAVILALVDEHFVRLEDKGRGAEKTGVKAANDYRRAIDKVREEFSGETRYFAELIRTVGSHRREDQGQALISKSSVKVVYVAGPFTAPTAWEIECNVRAAEAMGVEVAGIGAMPLIPHANTRFFHGCKTPDFWYKGTIELLRRCDAMLIVPGSFQSKGVRAEIDLANECGIPYFHSCEELSVWLKAEPG